MRRLFLNLPLILTLLLCAVVIGGKALGYTAHPILSGSMEPAIHTGSVALVKRAPVSTLQEGDIIAFKREGDAIGTAHRIVSITPKGEGYSIETKGDANEDKDLQPLVTKNPDLGVIHGSIPYVGYVTLALQTREGFLLLAFLFALTVALTFWPTRGEERTSEDPRTLTTPGATR